jgi:hypothetical protein
MAEGLDAADVARGLGRGGLMRSAVENAVRTSSVMGIATFSIRVESSGMVSVALTNASADTPAWARLSEAIKNDVASRRSELRLPPGAKGLDVVVRAEAREQFPDGRSPKSLGNRVEGTPGSIKETKERIDIKLPSVTFAHVDKVCAAGLHVGLDGVGIGGGCSPENAGTVPVRIVTTRIEREMRL